MQKNSENLTALDIACSINNKQIMVCNLDFDMKNKNTNSKLMNLDVRSREKYLLETIEKYQRAKEILEKQGNLIC